MNYKIEVACNAENTLGEGPVWDSTTNTICWIDIINGEIHELNPATENHRIINTHEMIGSFAVCTDGNFVAALQHGFAFINRETGKKTYINDPETDFPSNRFNDGKCDPAGRFWAGTMAFNAIDPSANLYRLNRNLDVAKMAETITISNGLDWSLDKKTFYYIDTPTFKVDEFDYDNETGEISNRRTVIEIPKEEGFPDGMCIDAAGMLWIAHWGGWQVTRWDPATGSKVDAIKLPVSQVTSCCFGGENLDSLYVTCAREGLTEKQLDKEPLAGSLFVIHNIETKGITPNLFQPSI